MADKTEAQIKAVERRVDTIEKVMESMAKDAKATVDSRKAVAELEKKVESLGKELDARDKKIATLEKKAADLEKALEGKKDKKSAEELAVKQAVEMKKHSEEFQKERSKVSVLEARLLSIESIARTALASAGS